MVDQIIDAAMAHALHTDACRAHPLVGWLVAKGLPAYPGKIAARLIAGGPTSYVIVEDTLAGIHAALPLHLERTARQPADPPEVIEIWFDVT